MADALEDGVGAEAVGQLEHALDRLVAPLAHDVGRAELLCDGDPIGMTAEEDDLLRAESTGRDHSAQAHCAVADDGNGLAGTDPGAQRGVVAGRQHVRESEQ